MMIYMKRGRKIMGLGRSKDLDSLMCYKGKWQRNHGLSQSKDWVSIANKLRKDVCEPK